TVTAANVGVCGVAPCNARAAMQRSGSIRRPWLLAGVAPVRVSGASHLPLRSAGGGHGARRGRDALAVALFPRLLVALGVEDEGGEADRLDDQPVDRRLREGQRAKHIDEEHHTRLVRLVPDLVVERVVEDQAAALLPMADVLADADAARLLLARDDQAEVIAQHPLVGAAVVEYVLARR